MRRAGTRRCTSGGAVSTASPGGWMPRGSWSGPATITSARRGGWPGHSWWAEGFSSQVREKFHNYNPIQSMLRFNSLPV